MKTLPWIAAMSLMTAAMGCGDDDGGPSGNSIEISVDAGRDQTGEVGQRLLLRPTIEAEPGYVVLWEGSGLEFDATDEAETAVTASEPGEYTATITVTSPDMEQMASDDVVLTFTEGGEPVALAVDAGENTEGLLGASVILDAEVTAEGSYTVAWSGAGLTFDPDDEARTSVTADASGVFTATITVRAGRETATDSVRIVFAEADGPPVANAGDDLEGEVGMSLMLMGQVAADGDFTVTWSGDGLTFSDPDALATTVTAAEAGVYTATLTAIANDKVGTATVLLTFVSPGGAPVVDAGENLTGFLGAPLTLAGTVIGGGEDVEISWTGEGLTFADPSDPGTTVTAEAAGEFTATLTAVSGDQEVSDAITLTFEEAVSLGPDPLVVLGGSLNLVASLTDGVFDAPTVAWSQESGPGTATFADGAALETAVAFDTVGTYVLAVTVADGDLEITASLSVEVRAPAAPLTLAVVGLANGLDTPLINFLRQRGHTVTAHPPEVDPASVVGGDPNSPLVDAVLISSNMDSDNLSAGWKDVTVPVLTWEFYALETLGMIVGVDPDPNADPEVIGNPKIERPLADGQGPGGGYIIIDDDTHPLAAGLSGVVRLSRNEQTLTAEPEPDSDAIVIGRLVGPAPDTEPRGTNYFAFDTGATMADGTAPARRVALPLGLNLAFSTDLGQALTGGQEQAIALTAAGKDVLEAALAWAVEGVYAPRTRVMPLGNSITRGTAGNQSYRPPLIGLLDTEQCLYDFVGTLQATDAGLPPALFDWDHEGHGGFTTGDVLSLLTDFVDGNVPDVVLIHLGTNDLLQAGLDEADAPKPIGVADVELAIANLEGIVTELRFHNPNVVVLLAQIIPGSGVLPGATEGLPQGVPLFNPAVADLAAALDSAESPVVLVDMFTDYDDATLNFDGIHPNVTGEQLMAERWFADLRPLLACTGVAP